MASLNNIVEDVVKFIRKEFKLFRQTKLIFQGEFLKMFFIFVEKIEEQEFSSNNAKANF